MVAPLRPPLGVAAAVILGCLVALPLAGQLGQSTGGIHGKVVDEQGGLLTSVAVTIQGPGADTVLKTDARGEFHLVNLSPGNYTLVLSREGFADLSRENVTVSLGRDTELTITMQLSAVTAMITVSDEAPMLDTRRAGTATTVSQQELRDIPTPRTPFAILATIPGIQIEGVNVAGAESNSQPMITSKGSHGATFQVDGINMTDMGGGEGASVYFDFDSFQEMQVVTGGSDPSIRGSNAHLNMITKRGTNALHGSARLFAVDERFGSDNLPSEAVAQGLDSGNHVVSIYDWGAEGGGPIWKDHVWLWGAYGRNQVNVQAAGIGGRNDSRIEDFNAKMSGQPFPSNSVEIWYLKSNKLNFGRQAGPEHPPPTTWDQTLPQNTWKLEDSQVFSANLFASVQYGGANGDFTLTPKGGLSKQMFVDEEGVWANTYGFFTSPSTQRQVKADSSYFFNTGRLGHELKAGFTYLKAFIGSAIVWPGDGSGGLAAQTWGSYLNCGVDADENPIACAAITRSSSIGTETKYWGAHLGDTITMDRLTVNLGVRWDEQYGTNRPSVAPGNPTFPEILPTLVYPGRPRDFTWKDWQPRFGATYAVGSRRNTVLKGSYAQYAEVLGIGQVSIPNNTTAAYAYYAWNDANHDNLVQPEEVDTSANGFLGGRGYNPQAPADALLPLNLVDSDLRAPRTDEVIFGIEHELLPAFSVGINYTHRKFTGDVYGPLDAFDPNTGYRFSHSDYEQYATLTGTTPDGVSYSEPVYRIKESVLDGLGLCTHDEEGGLNCQAPAGSFFVNRRDFRTTYDGAELVLTKRLTNRWMARGSFVYNDNRQHVDGPRACVDPTNLLLIFGPGNAQTCRDGDLVAVNGNRAAVFLNSKWQVNLLGQYLLPLGFAVAANMFWRQGYPINWYRQAPESGTDGVPRAVTVVPAGSSRYENVFELDMRVEKSIRISGSATATLSADLFNVTNENTVLQRQNLLEVGNTNEIHEIQSPRIWRFGARIAF